MKEIRKEFSQLWESAGSLKDSGLLRLSILRDLSRRFHAERMEDRERHLEWVRDARLPLESNTLDEILLSPVPKGTSEGRPIPLASALTRIISAEKLERYDRKWEARLGQLALDLGWSFWTLEAELAPGKAETFHQSLASRLWPRSILLFVESAAAGSAHGRNWNGRWTLVASPGFDPHALDRALLGVEPSWHRIGP